MEITERKLKGVFEITLRPITDNRGFFMRTFDEKIFVNNTIHRKWVQENHSRSEQKGVIRGLHFQFPPHSETKLVRCIKGAILDVFVDLRKDSTTFGKWDSIELSEENKKMIFIPRGFAHGFCTLTDLSEVLYKVDNFYTPEVEGGLLWNDPDLKINWPVQTPFLSEKDNNNMSFIEFKKKYTELNI
ncbi:MAG: dTDP-4-dehydrorhamnose 3,5-epimerase [Bacteroidales bacterium]|nr:dTDP-4-dehydrorhamnose 3,5-epimerase [Bacteroidales bacterium]